jgi:ADP-heptose:LPS heptosyltransferase
VGIGDAIMASGEARALHHKTKAPVLIVGRDGRPIWSEVFDGVPYLVKNLRGLPNFARIVNGPGVRPYIAAKTETRWTWRKYQPKPAEMFFTPAELAFAEPYRGMVMVEPHVKAQGHNNKAWGPIFWGQLDSAIYLGRIAKLVQCGPPGTRKLLHAQFVETDTFRKACAVLSVCRAFVGTEGGLHHAAAAVGTPAVVIFGGFISPAVTGYPSHRNLFAGEGLGCGMRTNCDHCRAAMTTITPAAVLNELKEILK